MNDDLDLDSLHSDDDVTTTVAATPDPLDPDTNASTADTDTDTTTDVDGTATADTASEPVTITDGVEEYLAQFNIEGGNIAMEGDNGETITRHYSELTPEELYNVLSSLNGEAARELESSYDLTDEEVAILNDLRNSGLSAQDYLLALANNTAKDFTTNDTTDFTAFSDEEIAQIVILSENPDATPEEIAAELETMQKSSLFKKNMDVYRNNFITAQEAEKVAKENELAAAREAELEADRSVIVNAVAPLDNVLGFPIDDNEKNNILESLLEVNDYGDSKFMEEVFSDPVKLFKTAWLYKNAENLISGLETYYDKEVKAAYNRGKNDIIKGAPTAKLSGIKNNTAQTSDKTGNRPVLSVDDIHED